MSHEVESMMSAREVPWHGLGTIVEDVQTAKDALILAGLDWEVELEPVYVLNRGDGVTASVLSYVEVPDKVAVIRNSDRSVFEIVGSRYTPVQNWRSFEFFDDLVDSGEAKYETAGSLHGGRVVWMTTTVPREMKIGGVDPVGLYLLLANSHDGSMAFTAAVTPVRVVCQNTLNLALSQVKQSWRLRHTESVDGKVDEARSALGLTFAYADQFQERMDALIAQEYTKREFEVLVKAAFPHKGDQPFSAEQYGMIGLLESSPTIDDSFRYTKWGALNAVREYDDWGRQFRQSKTKSLAEQRTEAAWFGPNVTRSNRVLALLEA